MFKDSSLSVANFPRFSANKIVGRDSYREWVLDGGQPKQIQRRRVLGLRAQMTKGQAEQALHEILQPLNGGERAPERTMTFGQFAAKWETEILPHYRESTKVFYKSTLDRW